MAEDLTRFKKLDFEGFRRLAQDDSLSVYQKIGFPDSYRKGKEGEIFEDIAGKLKTLGLSNQIVLDIGPGCSELPLMLAELCSARGHRLLLADSTEMLSLIAARPFIEKFPGRFPTACGDLLSQYSGKVNAILAYSVIHYVFAEASVFRFVDACLDLLAPGGNLLIGDIPNVSKRKRFFSSEAGIRFHREFMATEDLPSVEFNRSEVGEIDDGVIMGITLRARAAGFDAYIIPQADELPMSNRREDLLIQRP